MSLRGTIAQELLEATALETHRPFDSNSLFPSVFLELCSIHKSCSQIRFEREYNVVSFHLKTKISNDSLITNRVVLWTLK